MSIKDDKRFLYKKMRKNIENKDEKDKAVCEMFLNSFIYINAPAVFCYSALDDEINTNAIIEQAFKDGKRVALPACINDEGLMKFYTINSLDDLKPGLFGILEPDISKCRADTDFNGAVCVVPALSYDRKGHRLGYGKGYYDRFLKSFTSFSVGVCYNAFIDDNLPVNIYDKSVDFLITEDNILTF